MAVFTYKALQDDSSEVTGAIVADTPRQARDQLRARGLTVQGLATVRSGKATVTSAAHGGVPGAGPGPGVGLGYSPDTVQSPSLSEQGWARFRQGLTYRRNTARTVSFIRELSTLLGVGIPVLEAIDTVAKQHRGAFRSSLLMLRDHVSQGVGLAEAMRQSPELFDEITVHVTGVGESSGTLDRALSELADFQERAMQFRNRLVSALLYPCLVLAMGLGVSIFLMTYVVPDLLQTLVESGQPLPLSTRLVKGVSDGLLAWWWLLILVGVMAAGAFAWVLSKPRGRWAWDKLKLRLPLVGDLIRKQAVVRIAVVVSTLLKSGIELVTAVRIARGSTANVVLADALERCERAIESGRDVAAALESTGSFPAVVVQVVSVGQQSGKLEEMLDRLATDYDRQVASAAQRLTVLLEPALIVVLAVVIGLIAFATILPIMQAGNVL